MFEPTRVLIDQVIAKLETDFRSAFGAAQRERAKGLTAVGHATLERIAACNALYHNLNHTILVTIVGNDILRGKLATGVEVTPAGWVDFVVSLLCHDIGFVRPLCRGDRDDALATGRDGGTFTLPVEATDASLVGVDLLGQVSETWVRRRYAALFYEFEETGLNRQLGFSSPRDLRDDFPRFYSKVVVPYCSEALRLLEATADGRGWLANLHFHLADIESGLAGP